MKINNSKINFVIDILLFLVMIPVATIGILMKLILIPGSERWLKYGDNVELYILGMERHQWGTIHLILSLVLIGLFILHIIFHWKLILNWFKKFISNNIFRYTTLLFLFIFIVLLWIYPFIVKPEVEYGVQGVGEGIKRELLKKGVSQEEINRIQTNRDIRNNSTGKNQGQGTRSRQLITNQETDSILYPDHNELLDSLNIRGFMILSDVAEKYKIPVKYLMSKLNIPESESPDQKLGTLRRKYDIRMDDVKEIIFHFKNWE